MDQQRAKAQSETKGQMVERMLARKRGATVDELVEKTGWKKGSVMSRISYLKKEGIQIAKVETGKGPVRFVATKH